MLRTGLFLFAVALACFLPARSLYGHGGSFRGPIGGVPPGLRDPGDPDPPPPPPSDPGDPAGPDTPGEAPAPPDTGHETPGSSSPPPMPTPPSNGPRPGAGGARTASLTFESWRYWWGYNNDDILNLKAHLYAEGVVSSSPLAFGNTDSRNRKDVMRPTRAAIVKQIEPALLRTLERTDEHEDVLGGALVALGKIGGPERVALFDAALHNRWKNAQGRHVKLGGQATESAVLALGLLDELDGRDLATVREVCLAAVADESLRARERAWAAVCLGLHRDTEAVAPLLALLEKKYANDNVPAGILAGVGLVGNVTDDVRAELEAAFLAGKFRGRALSDRVRAFAGYALGKIADPRSGETVVKVLRSRRFGRMVKRSAAIAAGPIGARADDEGKDELVRALQKYLRKSGGDASGENFALIAMSQIGTEQALQALLKTAENGRYGQRPFAALGLGTHVFYANRDDRELDADLLERIRARLRKLSGKFKDADTKSAFLLSRALAGDPEVGDELKRIVARRSGNPVVRGYACVALGLTGENSPEARDALYAALRERKNAELRRDAATGLSLLHDGAVTPALLKELKTSKSFAVQGQLIRAIGTIGDVRAVAPLVGILDDTGASVQTRAMAAVGLGLIGDLRPLPKLARVSKNYNYRASVPDLDELLFIL